MPKHYHVISGMPGYTPNSNDSCATKREAEALARWWVTQFRADGERWTGSAARGGYLRVCRGPYDQGYYISIDACDWHQCEEGE